MSFDSLSRTHTDRGTDHRRRTQANKWQADAPVAQGQVRVGAVGRADEEEPRGTRPHASLSSATVVDDDEGDGGGLEDDASKL